MDEMPEFEPVKVKCRDTDCKHDRHCYRPKRWAKDKRTSTCQACGDDGVDWPLLRGRDLASVDGMFEQLQRELIRHVFFTAPLDKVARENIRKVGVDAIRAGVREHLRKKIGQAEIFRDGMQTPKKDRVVHFAQHATATCCRKCLDYWYDIPQGRDLTDEELTFCEGLVHAYMDGRAAEMAEAAAAEPAGTAATGNPAPQIRHRAA